MTLKRTLFLFHRWAGIVLCLFFALWFLSGLFMMYVEFPQLTRAERLSAAPTLDFASAALGPADAVARLRAGDFDTIATPSAMKTVEVPDADAPVAAPASVRLTMIVGRPAYVVHADNGSQPRVVFADTGEVLRSVTPAMGAMAAAQFVRQARPGEPARISFDEKIQTDQWTVSSGLNAHRPLLRYVIDDVRGTVLYVSSRTGEVVRDTHRRERVLNYFGAVTHWLYPTVVRKYPLLWEWIVDVVSAAGVLLGLSGLWIGVLRWKRRPRPGKSAVPYRGVMRWHYFTGIGFGVVVITWVLSGLLSMNPLNLNPSRGPEALERLVFAGKPLTVAEFDVVPEGLGDDAVEADLLHYEGQAFYRVSMRDASVVLAAAQSGADRWPSLERIEQRAPELLPEARVSSFEVLTSYDDYYYTRRPEHAEKALPIVRVRFEDSEATWFHLDPTTGQVVERLTRTNRVYRWLYNGLHSWDIRWLWERRPLWDICVIAFSLGGFLLSVIGVWIGVRRLRHPHGVTRHARLRALRPVLEADPIA